MSTYDAIHSGSLSKANITGSAYRNSWDDVREWHDAVNPTFVKIIDQMIKIRHDNAEFHYESIYAILWDIEDDNRKLIRILNSAWIRRINVPKMISTLSPQRQSAIRAQHKGYRR